MNTLKKHVSHHGLVVDYKDEVTDDQVRKIDEYVREEFEHGDWVTVEQEL